MILYDRKAVNISFNSKYFCTFVGH